MSNQKYLIDYINQVSMVNYSSLQEYLEYFVNHPSEERFFILAKKLVEVDLAMKQDRVGILEDELSKKGDA